MQVRAKKSQFAELRNQMFRERGFAAVLLDDGNDFVFDELPRRLPDQLFFVVQLRIKIDEVDSAISGHTALLISGGPGPSGPTWAAFRAALAKARPVFQGFSGKILCGRRCRYASH